MSLDKFAESEILATCNALGTEIRGIYEKGSDCIVCLKDILLYLKNDTDEHAILRFLGSIRLLQTDLLPLIKRYSKDEEIFEFTLRLLIALTNPALILFKEDLPDDKLIRNVYLQIVSYLQSYKKAFIDIDVWTVFYEHLRDLLKIRPLVRSKKENLFMERIFILVRNVLHIPADESVVKQTDDELSPHDKILECLHESKLNILILYLASNEEEHKYCLHVLEIVSLMLREHTSETLATSNETRSTEEKDKDLKALLAARQREQNLKMQKIQSLCTSRFSGVYCVKNMKSLSENDYISHKLITNTDDLKFDSQKNARRRPKNRLRAPELDMTRRSTLAVRLALKKFCIEFLKAYNKMMVSVKRELMRNVSEEHDDSYYLWAVCYFMQFNRLHDFQPALVSETISVQSFHHIQTQITNYQEMMLTDKKKTMFWAKRMQFGVSAYKELLETLKMMERSSDEIIKKSADALIGHVFYVIEYRELLLTLLSSYDEIKFPLSYLAKLVESAQLFLKMLENHSKKHSEIIVQKKQRKVRRKKKKKPAVNNESVSVEGQLNEQWDAVTNELSTVIKEKQTIPNVTPFDGASEMSFEEQKVEAVYKIREALINNEPVKAVGLLRAARELWPEGDSFGAADIDSDSEILVLKEIHFSNLQKDDTENTNVEADRESDEDDEEMEAMPAVTEQNLDVHEIYKKYATHKVVQPCALLLANYQNNSPQTNACLIKLLHRIAWSCKMHALFFQSSIFLTFQKIFHDPDVSISPVIKEFSRFAKFIMQKFFAAAQKNNKIFVEMLFWKGPREAYELEEGYGTSESKIKGWTEDEDEELKYLYEENKDIYIEGQDVADIILANFNGKSKTKPQVISALKRLGLIKSVVDLKPEKRKEWQETEIIELQHLFEDYKGSDDIMGAILDKLSIKRSKKAVINKLLELNLIADRKEVRKKTTKKRSKKSENDSEGHSSDEDKDSDDDSEEEERNFSESNNFNSDTSGDEAEANFFKNLEAERNIDENDSLHDKTSVHSERRKPDSDKGTQQNRPKKVWKEEEIMELTRLFHENRDSDNILSIILDSLSVKRSKRTVVEKLLELRLIQDKKEIRKKKEKKEINVSQSHLKSSKNSLTDAENSENDSESSVSENIYKDSSKAKKFKRRILSDSSDDDTHNSRNLNETLQNFEKTKKNDHKTWKEEEIIELNQLFVEYKENDDVMSSILSKLSSKRPKKSVVEKMLEIGLIQDKKELKPKKATNKSASSKGNASCAHKRKKQSDPWDEGEILELNQLYGKHHDSDDIMTSILDGLSIKRNKQNVIEKMLEIGLIHDKKEVRKKRASKNKVAESKFLKYKNSVDKDFTCKSLSNEEGSDSSDDDTPLTFMTSNASPKSSSAPKRKKQSDPWDEGEILELNQLYGKHHDSDDIMTNILDGLSIKRNKQNIVEKMLEIGLIHDKKEVKKKRTSKNKKANSKFLKSTNSADEDFTIKNLSNEEEVDSSDDDTPLTFMTSNALPKSNEKNPVSLPFNIDLNGTAESNQLPPKDPSLNSAISEPYEDDLPLKNTKRKRCVINSEDSSSDEAVRTEELHKDNSLGEIFSVGESSEDTQSNSLLKKQKKRIRVLEDSDDSS